MKKRNLEDIKIIKNLNNKMKELNDKMNKREESLMIFK